MFRDSENRYPMDGLPSLEELRKRYRRGYLPPIEEVKKEYKVVCLVINVQQERAIYKIKKSPIIMVILIKKNYCSVKNA